MKLFSSLWIGMSFFYSLSAQVSMGVFSSVYSQDFGALGPVSFNWVNNFTLPNWYAQRSAGGNTFTSNNGTSTTGDLYNYGVTNAPDRSLGSLGAANTGDFSWGVLLRNTSGVPISSLSVSYTGEQWRHGSSGTESVLFYYKRSTTAISDLQPNNNATWTPVTALNFSSPITTGTARSLDGNLAANRAMISSEITFSTPLADGEYLMLKWDDIDHPGADDGLSTDDLSLR